MIDNVRRYLMPLLLASAVALKALPGDSATLVFLPNEELRYSVKWKFIRLGTITIKRIDDGADDRAFRVSMLVESNPSIPFVDIREYNESLIDAATFKTIEFKGDYRNKKTRTKIRHVYDEPDRTIYHYEWDGTSGICTVADTVRNAPPFVNGPSLFAYTRIRSFSSGLLDVPTFVNGSVRNTRLDFLHGTEEIKIGVWPYPVRVRKYHGKADWEGGTSQGLSGDFTGWISADFAAVPIRAEMKVVIGSVRIELESWQRPDWTPLTSQRVSR